METFTWWEVPKIIRIHVNGVFEGGGAKGLTYVGGLRAMKKLDVGVNLLQDHLLSK